MALPRRMPFVPVFFQIKTVSFCCDSACIVGHPMRVSQKHYQILGFPSPATINILVMSRQAMPGVSIDDSEKDDRHTIHNFMKGLCRRDDEDNRGISIDQISKRQKKPCLYKE
jgi:hypothetical protein